MNGFPMIIRIVQPTKGVFPGHKFQPAVRESSLSRKKGGEGCGLSSVQEKTTEPNHSNIGSDWPPVVTIVEVT